MHAATYLEGANITALYDGIFVAGEIMRRMLICAIAYLHTFVESRQRRAFIFFDIILRADAISPPLCDASSRDAADDWPRRFYDERGRTRRRPTA